MDSIQEVLKFNGVYCNFQLVEVCKLFQSSADVLSQAVWELVSQALEGVLSAAFFPSVAQLGCNHSPVDLYESKAKYGSSDFIIKSFAVLTALSTSPLLCG